MRWTRTLQTIDVHCAGEIGRVVSGGVVTVPGDTMAAKLAHINEIDDGLRRLLCSEPRSGPAGSFILLPPSTRPEADIGFIVLQPDKAHAMSGSNAMCAVTAILETGMKPMREPQTTVTLDTAAGLVRAVADCENGRVTRISLDMPPSFVTARDASLATEDWGSIRYDLCFGGVFYALVDVAQLGLAITPQNARTLSMAGVALHDAISADREVRHPTTPELDGLAYVMFHSTESDGAVRTCTTLRPGRADRSPCGTGSNALMALRHARSALAEGERLTTRSIIGGEFVSEFLGEDHVGTLPATRIRISGQSWIYGFSQIGLDPSDPFPLGFTLSDTWGSSGS